MTDRRSARRTAKRTGPVRRPKYGPWNDRDVSGWTICAVHDYGIAPGGTCLSCRLPADMAADPEAYGLPD